MEAILSVVTNQFFMIFLAIALGLALGKIKIGNFSLGVSGGIFSGIVIGYFAYDWASKVQEGQVGYSSASTVLKNGVVSNLFFTFFLMLFLVAIGMKVGSGIGAIFKRYPDAEDCLPEVRPGAWLACGTGKSREGNLGFQSFCQ